MKYISLWSSFLFLSTSVSFCDGIFLEHSQAPSRNSSIKNESDIVKSILDDQNKKPDKQGNSTEERPAYKHAKRPHVPVINIVVVRDTNFDALVSLAHWFSGFDLPYHAQIPPNVQEILRNARQVDSEVYINSFVDSTFVTASDHMEILFNLLADDHIRFGYHEDPDLKVVFSVNPDLDFFKMAAENGWCNNTNVLFIIEDFGHNFTSADLEKLKNSITDEAVRGAISDDLLDVYRWDNAIGLVPTVPRYVLPSFFPSRARHTNKNQIATFCVQGNFEKGFDFAALERVLSDLTWGCKWDMKLNGDGIFPYQLNSYRDKIELLRMDAVALNDFFDYECHFLLPLVSNTTNLRTIQTRLQPTVTRAIGHRLPIVGWQGLKQVYPMVDGYFYTDDASFKSAMQEAMNCR